MAAFATPQLAQLDLAIKAKDKMAFVAAYEELPAACNQCHQATNHGIVVIETLGSTSFPDQPFASQTTECATCTGSRKQMEAKVSKPLVRWF
jgi:hypothetical protein